MIAIGLQELNGSRFGVIVGICVLVAILTVPAASQPDVDVAEQLRELAKRISSDDPEVQSIVVEAWQPFNQPPGFQMAWTLHFAYQAPDRYVFRVFDHHDNTPLLVVTHRKILFYDPVGGQVLVSDNMGGAGFVLAQENDRLQMAFGYRGMLLDLPSLFQNSAQLLVRQEAEGRYKLTSTSERGNRIIFELDTSQPHPYTGLTLFLKDVDEPLLVVKQITVNSDIEPAIFELPHVEELPNVREFENLVVEQVIMRALGVRWGVRNPEHRDLVGPLDWERIEASDRQLAPVLRKVLAPSKAEH